MVTWELVLKTKPRAFYLGINKALFFLSLDFATCFSGILQPPESCLQSADPGRRFLGSHPVRRWLSTVHAYMLDNSASVCVCVRVKDSIYTQRWYSPTTTLVTCVVLATKVRPREDYSNTADIYFFSHTMCKSEKSNQRGPAFPNYISFHFGLQFGLFLPKCVSFLYYLTTGSRKK